MSGYVKLPAQTARKIALDGFKVYTLYRNEFPWNCGYKDQAGTVWGDCWCMFPKALIWSWAVGKNLFLDRIPGTYFYNGYNGSYDGIGASGLGDWDGNTIMNYCEDVSSDFRNLETAELLLIYNHHMAMYIGDFNLDGKIYNSVEFNDFDSISGLVPFWTASDGGRYWYKGGGYMGGSFNVHGKLSRWIEYDSSPEPETDKKFTYQVYSDVVNRWLDNVVNITPDPSGDNYAGIYGCDVKCVLVNCNKGNVRYAIHTWKGDDTEWYGYGIWLPEVENRSDYAGIMSQPADAFILFSDIPAKYRVGTRKNGIWLPWVYTNNANYEDDINGYAGNIGEPFDVLQICPV